MVISVPASTSSSVSVGSVLFPGGQMGDVIPQVCPWSVLGCPPSWSRLRTSPNRAWPSPPPLSRLLARRRSGDSAWRFFRITEAQFTRQTPAARQRNLITAARTRDLIPSVTIQRGREPRLTGQLRVLLFGLGSWLSPHRIVMQSLAGQWP